MKYSTSTVQFIFSSDSDITVLYTHVHNSKL
jgi:hypothetical protein